MRRAAITLLPLLLAACQAPPPSASYSPLEAGHRWRHEMRTERGGAVGESVETRAGRFTDCLRVRGRAAMRLYADSVAGWRDMPLATTEWYCKGVGLVRLVREEPAQSPFLSGGTLTMELIEWQ